MMHLIFKKEGPIMGTELKAADFVTIGDSTGETVSLGEIAGLHTNRWSFVTQLLYCLC